MRYTSDILHLQQNPKYPSARKLLACILTGEVPDDALIEQVYNVQFSTIKPLLLQSLTKEPLPLRKHTNAPMTITKMRLQIGNEALFQQIQSDLLNWKVPSDDLLQQFYGSYAQDVKRSLSLFIAAQKTRVCGVPLVAHHNRVAGIIHALGLGDRYVAIAAFHDLIEDLLYDLKDEKGYAYGLKRYLEFVEHFTPKDLQKNIILLTNHYDLVFKYIDSQLKRLGQRFTKEHAQKQLARIDEHKYFGVSKYVNEIITLLPNMPQKDFFKAIKWECYSNLYIKRLAAECAKVHDAKLYLIKLADLSDNSHSRESLEMNSRIKNCVKQIIAVDHARAVKLEGIDQFIDELEEDALVYAEYVILKDLLEEESTLDFFMSGMKKIKDLEKVFYKAR